MTSSTASRPTPSERPTFFAGLSPLISLLVKPAWVHHPPGHSALPPCYHERSAYLTRFLFTDNHESGSSPDMEITVRASFSRLPYPWDGAVVPKGYLDYVDADEEDTDYPLEGDQFPEIWTHPGHWCKGQVFDDFDSNYEKEDWINVKVMERDLGSWLNPDDKVGEWEYVYTFGRNPAYLTPTHDDTKGSPQHAYGVPRGPNLLFLFVLTHFR